MRKVFGLALALLAVAIMPLTVWAQENGGHKLKGKHAEMGLACKDCHGTDAPTHRAPVAACKGCHDGAIKIPEVTVNVSGRTEKASPHASHLGEVPCTQCHHMHKSSELYCNQCHQIDVKVP